MLFYFPGCLIVFDYRGNTEFHLLYILKNGQVQFHRNFIKLTIASNGDPHLSVSKSNKKKLKLNCIIIFLVLLSCYFIITGCAKEYSYEGGIIPVITDSIPSVTPAYVCPACPGNDNFQENKWSLLDDTLLRCGIIDTAIVSPERTGFTFFGPSSCSEDTGIIMTIYLDTVHLNRDITNVTFSRNAFYYYDNVLNTYIYMSAQFNPFTVTLISYNHQTKLAWGSFSGFAYKTNGGGSSIRSGKFKVKLH